MQTAIVRLEIDEETWQATVRFSDWHSGPQHDEAPATVTRDGEPVEGCKWAQHLGRAPGQSRENALVEHGGLWAPGVMGERPVTEHALAVLTAAVQQAVVGHGREMEARVA